ncbi:PQ loop repeat-domain-containing protein [Pilobolus umbonatus]|nr:PQ loop repeat-domain-containing protein [Pilobolus umbonatus]
MIPESHHAIRTSSRSSNSTLSYPDETASHSSGLSHRDTQLSVNENSPLLSRSNSTIVDVNSSGLQTKLYTRIFFVLSIIIWVGLLVGSVLFFFGPGSDKVDMSRWHLVPQLLGWGSACLYCFSRIPQIMQNFNNESVEGLSLTMFIFSVVGNITYCISIMLVSLDPTYLLINYPWLLGSGGTLFFDFTIFFQFYMYRKRTDTKVKNIQD